MYNIDTITSAAFHPYYPILFTCSGQRKFKLNIEDYENENSNRYFVLFYLLFFIFIFFFIINNKIKNRHFINIFILIKV